MDGITYDQLQAAFGEPLSGLEKGIEKLHGIQVSQIDALTKLQQFLGQKVEPIIDYQKDLIKKVNEIANYTKNNKNGVQSTSDNTGADKKSNISKNASGVNDIKLISANAKTIPSSLKVLPVRLVSTNNETDDSKGAKTGLLDSVTSTFSSLFGKSNQAKSSYNNEEVNLLIPAETEVQLQNIIGDTIRPQFNRQNQISTDLLEVTSDIHKLIVSQNKKPEDAKSWWQKLLGVIGPIGSFIGNFIKSIPGILMNIGKQIIPLVGKLLGPLMPLLAGAGLAVAGIMTLIDGIKDSGPYKGIKKLLGKGLLNAGMAILKKEFNKIAKLGSEALSEAGKSLSKSFKSVLSGIKNLSSKIFSGSMMKTLLDGVKSGASKLFSAVKGIAGKVFGTITKTVTSLFSGLAEKVGGGVLSKLGGGAMKGFVTKLLGGALKLLKKIPLIGSLITIGFAVSRFKNGDIIGGGLEVLSGIAALFPGLGTGVSIAIDALNALLDYKAGGATGKQQGAKMSIIKDMFKWIENKIKYVPIIGPLTSMGIAIMDGKWGEALKHLAKGLFPPLGIIVDLFENSGTVNKAVTKSIDFVGSISKWLFDRFKYVPVFGPLIGMVSSITEGKWMDAIGYLAKAAIPPLGILVDLLDNKEAVGNAVTATGDWLGQAASWIYNKAKNIPIIGSLIKAGEAIAGGKWDEVLGFLGEAIEPLQYIGGLIAGGVQTAAVNIGGGVSNFFTSMKDSLLRAVLYMIPDINIGSFSLRKTVAGLLGISDGPSSTSGTSSTINVNPKTGNTSSTPTAQQPSNNTEAVAATDETRNTLLPNIKPAQDQSPTALNTNYNENKFDTTSLDNALQAQTNFMKAQFIEQKKTADYTKELIEVFKTFMVSAGKTVNVNTINSPTSFISGPTSSVAFRSAMLER